MSKEELLPRAKCTFQSHPTFCEVYATEDGMFFATALPANQHARLTGSQVHHFLASDCQEVEKHSNDGMSKGSTEGDKALQNEDTYPLLPQKEGIEGGKTEGDKALQNEDTDPLLPQKEGIEGGKTPPPPVETKTKQPKSKAVTTKKTPK